jgi:serine phosphatase RsbU (regulator of sigma subunit)
MEGVLLSMDLATGQGYYAAAGSLGLLVHDSGSQELAYDPRAIGSLRRKGRRESLSAAFTSRPLDMSHGERLFLFSDGFKDQLGRRTRQSERVRKYGKLRFQQLLRKVAFQSPEQARAHLQQELADWKGPRQQVDDVMVLGLRLT